MQPGVKEMLEAQAKHRLIPRGGAVLDLGCAPGAWQLLAMYMCMHFAVCLPFRLVLAPPERLASFKRSSASFCNTNASL